MTVSISSQVCALEKKDVIFSRMTPKQKLALTQYLKDQGNLVIAVGDGLNDAPMIRAADIGTFVPVQSEPFQT